MKRLIKYLITIVASLHGYIYKILYKNIGFSYSTIAKEISKFTGIYGIMLRRYFYSKTLERCGNNLVVGYGAVIIYPTVKIGDRCAIEDYSIVSRCIIGDDVVLAARCSLLSGAHHHNVDDFENTFQHSKSSLKTIVLGNNLWIGTHSVIMSDVSEGTVVGAGAVVTKKFPPNMIIGGVPANIIRKRGIRNIIY